MSGLRRPPVLPRNDAAVPPIRTWVRTQSKRRGTHPRTAPGTAARAAPTVRTHRLGGLHAPHLLRAHGGACSGDNSLPENSRKRVPNFPTLGDENAAHAERL